MSSSGSSIFFVIHLIGFESLFVQLGVLMGPRSRRRSDTSDETSSSGGSEYCNAGQKYIARDGPSGREASTRLRPRDVRKNVYVTYLC